MDLTDVPRTKKRMDQWGQCSIWKNWISSYIGSISKWKTFRWSEISSKKELKWIMVYQCHLTKFVILRPCLPRELMRSPLISTVGYIPPLQCISHPSEWQKLRIHSPSHHWAQRCGCSSSWFTASPDIPKVRVLLKEQTVTSNIVVAWMSDNNTQNWTVGLKFVQQQKNSTHHDGINRIPTKQCLKRSQKLDWHLLVSPPKFLKGFNLKMTFWHQPLPPLNQHLLTTMSHLQPPTNKVLSKY